MRKELLVEVTHLVIIKENVCSSPILGWSSTGTRGRPYDYPEI